MTRGREREWLREQLEGATALPMGNRIAPARRWQRIRGRMRPMKVLRVVLTAGGLCAAVAAGLLAAFGGGSQISVSLDADTYRVGGAVLHRVSDGTYVGAGVVVIRQRGHGMVRAAASAQEGGLAVTGVCDVDVGHALERCRFQLGGRRLEAVDVYERHGWTRRYADGVVVRLEAASPIPVPFPVGR